MDYSGSFNGMTWGTGTDIHLITAEGVFGAPPLRTADIARPGADGSFYGRDLYANRVVTLTFHLVPRLAGNTLDTLSQQFEQAMVVQRTGTLPLTLDAGTKALNCRPVAFDVTRQVQNVELFAVATAQFRAADPLFYDAMETVLGVPVFIAGGGWLFPWVFPWTFSASGSPGSASGFNTGSIETPPSFRVPGPMDVGFELRNLTTGAILQVAIPMGAGDWTDVDMGAETVMFQSFSDRRNAIVQGTNFWKMPPGPNTVRMTSLGATAPTTGYMHYRSAYISLRA